MEELEGGSTYLLTVVVDQEVSVLELEKLLFAGCVNSISVDGSVSK